MKRIYSSVLKKSAKNKSLMESLAVSQEIIQYPCLSSVNNSDNNSSLAPDPIRVWTYV